VLVAALACWSAARASPDEETDEVRRAKTYFEVGRAHFKAGEFEAAARAFGEGYAVVPRSTFLLNMGLCYRHLKQLDRAEEAFRRFLQGAAPDDPYRTQARELLDEILRERAGDMSPATVLVPPSPVVMAVPPPAPGPSPAAERRRRRLRTLAWALPTGVVLATGLVVGLVLGLRAGDAACGGERFGCLDLR
jgi:Tfp pilus assembly protein PilF